MMYPASVAIVRYLAIGRPRGTAGCPAGGAPTNQPWLRLSACSATWLRTSLAIMSTWSPSSAQTAIPSSTSRRSPTAAPSPARRIVFVNDLNDEFEPWLEPLLKQSGFTGTKVVASRGAKTITAEEEHPISGKEAAPVIDQHAWLDPRNGIVYVKNIAQALERADPANAADYRARAASYVKQLQSVDAWIRTEMAAVPAAKRRIIASHDLASISGEGVRHHADLDQRLDQQKRAVGGRAGTARPADRGGARACAIPRQHHRPARHGADRKGDGRVITGTLYGDALSTPGGEAGTYIEMIRHDVATLKAGMLKN